MKELEELIRLFNYITTKYMDFQWSKSRDDLISKTIKALRAFNEGKTLEEVKNNKEISFQIEDSLETLKKFSSEHPNVVEKLIKALSIYLKSPAPCKTRLISLMEVFLEDMASTKKHSF